MNRTSAPSGRDIAGWSFLKGHGTGNDFVLLPDLEGERDPTPAEVARICDRHFGVGADGILRVVPTALVPEVSEQAAQATYFMDYRNADGSLAEMCGNGIRVFARYLVFAGLATAGTMQIATRGGVREVSVDLAGEISVDLGDWRATGAATVTVNGMSYEGTGIAMANPHVVVEVSDLAAVGRLTVEPSVEPAEAFSDGVNFEFLVRLGPRHLAMRVHERGSGETLSCGTGAAAVAAYVASTQATTERADYQVDVEGGTLHVVVDGTRVWLRGPAVLVAQGRISDALRATGGG